MATRMQQRRGTASQWTTANPILASGEIGFESDTNQFKIGDGTNHWADLSYFKNLESLGGSLDDYLLLSQVGTPGYAASLDVNGFIPVGQLGNIIGEAPAILDTIEELAYSLQSAEGLVAIAINDKATAERAITDQDIANAVSTSATSITNAYGGAITEAVANEATARDAAIQEAISTEVINRDTAVSDAISTEVINRDSAISNAIANEVSDRDAAITQEINTATANLEDYADTAANTAKSQAETAAQGYVSDHSADTTNVHGISDTAALATKTYADNAVSTHQNDTTNIHGIADTAALATKAYTDNAVAGISKSSIGLGDVDNIPSSISADGYTVAVRSTTGSLAATGIELSNVEMVEGRISMPFNNGFENHVGYITNQLNSDGGIGLVSDYVTGLWSPSVSLWAQSGNISIDGFSGINLYSADGNIILNTDGTNKSYIESATSGNEIVKKSELDLKAPIANPTFTGTVSGITKSMVGLGNVDNTTDANKPVSTATQTALDLKAPKAAPTFTGTLNAADVVISGNLTVSGTTTTVSANNLVIDDSLIYLADQNTSSDALDIGIYGAYSPTGTGHKHTGLFRDASDSGKWKLISNGAEPTSNVIDLTSVNYDTLVLGTLEATSATIGNVSNTELQYLDGVTSAIQTQIDAKAPLANPTFTGTVSGITKSMVGLANVDNTSDANKPISSATQTALDAKLASATAASTYETITNVALKAPKASPSFTGGVTVDSSGIIFTDGTQVKQGVPSLTSINQQTGSYTPVLTDRDKLVEVSSASGVTLTIPANSSVAYPIGTSFDILQTGAGQVTIAGAAGVTVNATPGLKLRTQWSSATLFKRATDTWVVFGDLSA